MINFINEDNEFSFTVRLIEKYIQDHADPELFESITIVADIKNKTLTATHNYLSDIDNTLVLRQNDLEKPLITALALIGYASVMENIGDIEPDHFDCVYSGDC